MSMVGQIKLDSVQNRSIALLKWEKHLGLWAAGGAAMLVGFKILAVAHGNWHTAFGILAENGKANVITGTLIATLPLLMIYTVLLYVGLLPIIWKHPGVGGEHHVLLN